MKRNIVILTLSFAILVITFEQQGCGGGTTSNQNNVGSNSSANTNAEQQTADTESASTNATPKCTIDKPFVLPAGCKLPFNGRTGLDVDQHCPREGCAKNAASQAQDLQKNNFCATSKPVELSFQSFSSLQSFVDTKQTFDYEGTGKSLGSDRKGLTKVSTVDVKGNPVTLSEGDVVTLTWMSFHSTSSLL